MTARILLIDDSEAELTLIRNTLQKNGHQTYVAKTGKEGIEIARKKTLDMILLDIVMPAMDGFETCRQLKTDEQLRYIPVVFLTGQEDPESVNKGLAAGAVDFISKPFNKNELLLRLDIHIGRHKQQSQLQTALKKSQQDFKVMLDYTYNAEFFTDQEGKLVYVSPSFERIFGYSREKYLKEEITLDDFVHPEDKEATYREFYKFQREKTIIDFVFRIFRPDSSVAWLALSSQPAYDEFGNYLGNRSSIRDITLQKHTSQELKKSRERFRALVENTADWLWEIDKNGIYTYSSPQVENILGYKSAEIIGRSPFNLMPQEEKQRIGDFFLEKAKNQQAFQGLINIALHKNGSKVYLETSAVPVFDADKQLIAYRGIDRDITERYLSQQKLQEQYQQIREKDKALQKNLQVIKEKNTQLAEEGARLRMIFNSVTDALVTINEEGIIKSFNPAAERMFGYTEKEAIDRNVKTLMPEKYASEHNKYIYNYLVTKERKTLGKKREVFARKKSGKLFPVELRIEEAWLGNKRRFVGAITDISKRREAEKAMKDSEEKLRQMAENVSEVFWLMTLGKVLYINPAYEKIWGKTRQSLYEKPLSFIDSIISEDRKKIWEAINKLFDDGSSVDETFRIKKPNGEIRWIKTYVVVVETEAHQENRYAGTATDITHLKQIQQQLQQAKEEAEAANRAKTAFISNISHEIKTPLNSIQGFSDVLYEKAGPELQNYIEKIQASGKRLQTLFNDILTLAELDKEKLELQYSPVNLRKLYHKVVETFRHDAVAKGLQWHFKEAGAFPELIRIDKYRLKQIMHNLLSNAVKFTQDGYIETTVEVLPESDNKIDLTIRVKDTGIGIPEEFLPKLFKPFQQQDQALNRNYEGAGLGLAVTKNIVEQMKGTVEVWSKYGEGSIFTTQLKGIEVVRREAAPAEEPNSTSFSHATQEEGQTDRQQEIKANSADEELIPEIPTEQLNELIKLLEDKPQNLWANLQKRQSIGEAKQFSQEVAQIGKRYNIKLLENFADELVQSCNTFDIVQINQLLKHYPEILKRLKNQML